MSVEMNGIAHIQLTVNDADRCVPFWEKFCHFLEMRTLIKGEEIVYCIGSRTGILVRVAPPDKRDTPFDQNRAGLHHFCFRARTRDDVDADHRWFYYPEMRADEVLLLTCYDSRDGRARFTAHSAFDDPHAPPDAPPRESVEVRTLAFF